MTSCVLRFHVSQFTNWQNDIGYRLSTNTFHHFWAHGNFYLVVVVDISATPFTCQYAESSLFVPSSFLPFQTPPHFLQLICAMCHSFKMHSSSGHPCVCVCHKNKRHIITSWTGWPGWNWTIDCHPPVHVSVCLSLAFEGPRHILGSIWITKCNCRTIKDPLTSKTITKLILLPGK